MCKKILTISCPVLGIISLNILLNGCAIGIKSTVEPPEEVVEALNNSPENVENFTHIIQTANEQYYLDGPQQARAPDGSFPKGTRVRLIRNAGSYSIVQSESGTTAHVTSGCLKQIGKN